MNPITEERGITPFVMDQVDELYTYFNDEVVPKLLELLAILGNLKEIVPLEIRNCIDTATSRLSDEAIVLRNTLEFC